MQKIPEASITSEEKNTLAVRWQKKYVPEKQMKLRTTWHQAMTWMRLVIICVIDMPLESKVTAQSARSANDIPEQLRAHHSREGKDHKRANEIVIDKPLQAACSSIYRNPSKRYLEGCSYTM